MYPKPTNSTHSNKKYGYTTALYYNSSVKRKSSSAGTSATPPLALSPSLSLSLSLFCSHACFPLLLPLLLCILFLLFCCCNPFLFTPNLPTNSALPSFFPHLSSTPSSWPPNPPPCPPRRSSSCWAFLTPFSLVGHVAAAGSVGDARAARRLLGRLLGMTVRVYIRRAPYPV